MCVCVLGDLTPVIEDEQLQPVSMDGGGQAELRTSPPQKTW